MRRGGEQRARPLLRAPCVLLVERFHRAAEVLRLAADFVQGDEAVVDVEGGVLEPLGHHRPEHLLQLEGERVLRGTFLLFHVGGEFLQ